MIYPGLYNPGSQYPDFQTGLADRNLPAVRGLPQAASCNLILNICPAAALMMRLHIRDAGFAGLLQYVQVQVA